MNAGDIRKMEAGAAMDMLVDKFVMENDPIKYLAGYVKTKRLADGRILLDEDEDLRHYERLISISVPNYSTDTATAFIAVDKMLFDKDGAPNKFHLMRYGRWGDKRKKIVWQALYAPGWANLLDQATADTVPLAICRVLLIATMKLA